MMFQEQEWTCKNLEERNELLDYLYAVPCLMAIQCRTSNLKMDGVTGSLGVLKLQRRKVRKKYKTKAKGYQLDGITSQFINFQMMKQLVIRNLS